jgi:tetratricopeptide (TPR) repeat protein
VGQRHGGREERGSLFVVLTVHLWRGHALWRRGELLEAEESLRACIRELEIWGAGLGNGYALGFLALVLLERGQVEAAAETVALPLEPVAGSDGERLIREARAAVHLALGRPEEAMRELDLAAGVVAHMHSAAWRGSAMTEVDVLLALGRVDEAVTRAEAAVRSAREFGSPSALGVALRALAAARAPAGEAELREAVTLLAGTSRRLEHAHALAQLADLLRPEDSTHANALAQEALRLAEACAATALATRLRTTLVAAGVHAQASADALGVLDAEERQVARLLRHGGDHLAVAQALSISPTAAQRQVEQVQHKLASAGVLT